MIMELIMEHKKLTFKNLCKLLNRKGYDTKQSIESLVKKELIILKNNMYEWTGNSTWKTPAKVTKRVINEDPEHAEWLANLQEQMKKKELFRQRSSRI